jgi:hypothetical protein
LPGALLATARSTAMITRFAEIGKKRLYIWAGFVDYPKADRRGDFEESRLMP